jgi:site-specific recombinase XerD
VFQHQLLKEDVMLTEFFYSPLRLQELRDSCEAALLEGFARELYQVGYPATRIRRHIRAAEHLIYWSAQDGKPLAVLDERSVDDFARHLDRCQCPRYGHTDLRNGARLFINYLRRADVLTTSISEQALEVPALIASFCLWMREQRGICDRTLQGYRSDLCDLLKSLGEDPSKFDAHSLRKFVLERSQRCGAATAKRCTTAVRMFLRFLIANGLCVAGLDESVPVLAHWRLSSLPRYLQSDEVERVIDSCNLSTQVGKRDRAILLLLARLGLRAGDVVRLCFSDIDWKEAWIHVAGKGRREVRLPLTQEVGDAIAAYLEDRTARTDSDRLFIRVCSPFCALASHCAISVIVKKAMRRAGITCPSRGAAHVLRHSAASSMLRQGASLQEIADVLRHRSIETTSIYAKVDVIALRQVAQPWPEVTAC